MIMPTPAKKSYFLPMTARNMKVPVVCMKQSIPILLIIPKKQRRSFHLHTAPVAHRTNAFMQKYASYEDGHGAEKICRQVFLHEDCCRKYQYHGNGKKNILIYAGDLDLNGITTVLYSQLHELDLTRYNYFISFRSLYVKDHPERMERLPEGVGDLSTGQ